jgi:hypothetical protein
MQSITDPIHNESEDDVDGDSTSGDTSHGSASSVFLPMPFEVESNPSDDALFPSIFWTSSEFLKVDWFSSSSVQWGKWVYDPRTKTLRHSLTHRSFSLLKINDPTRLLKVLASLLVQPHSDTEQFYQLASGILKNRHGADWNSFWAAGESTFTHIISKPASFKGTHGH